jgi:hypothetical protein
LWPMEISGNNHALTGFDERDILSNLGPNFFDEKMVKNT